MKLHSIKRGLRAGPFADSLAINPSRSLTEFREQAVGYINMKEVRETRKAEAQTENGRAKDSKQKHETGEKKPEEIRACPKGEGLG